MIGEIPSLSDTLVCNAFTVSLQPRNVEFFLRARASGHQANFDDLKILTSVRTQTS